MLEALVAVVALVTATVTFEISGNVAFVVARVLLKIVVDNGRNTSWRTRRFTWQ